MSDSLPRILLAEDDTENREALRLMLQYSGFDCLEAADGQIALQTALNEKPDILLTDLSLPEIDGFDLVARLRAQNFEQPIIVLSAYDDPGSQRRAFDAGANEYLTKPLEFSRLKTTIDELLSQA